MDGYERKYNFFEGYYRAMAHMDDGQELAFRRAIDRFVFEGEVPEFHDPMLLVAWDLVVPSVERSIKLAEAGRRGGRGNKKPDSKEALKGAEKGLKAPLKGSVKAFKPPFNEKESEKEKEIEKEKGAALERMYSQRVRVVPVEEEA